jgi:BirA family biotin operon repressor/biotin-[acetyl-CoA-carboxylase] ligase
VELLDADRISAQLDTVRARRLHALELLPEVDSSNTWLLAAPPPPGGTATVCIAEHQSAGRGRLGRRWIAPPGAAITLSVGWSFRKAARDLPALSLATGVAVARALARCGARGVQLKWPNDVWFEDRKLGGILLELRPEPDGQAFVVIGVGVNVTLDAAARAALDAQGVRAADLVEACALAPSRNRVAGALLDELLGMLMQFEHEGFTPFRAPWAALDALRGRPSRVLYGNTWVSGLPDGVDGDGALVFDIGGQVRRFSSGEVSLRLEGDIA